MNLTRKAELWKSGWGQIISCFVGFGMNTFLVSISQVFAIAVGVICWGLLFNGSACLGESKGKSRILSGLFGALLFPVFLIWILITRDNRDSEISPRVREAMALITSSRHGEFLEWISDLDKERSAIGVEQIHSAEQLKAGFLSGMTAMEFIRSSERN